MNENTAETLLRKVLPGARSHIDDAEGRPRLSMKEVFAEDMVYHGFDASGQLRRCVGLQAFSEFARECRSLMEVYHDEVLSIVSAGPDVAILHARAHRRAKHTGESVTYEYGLLMRTDNGKITYGADLIDQQTTEFWQRAYAASQA